MKRIRRLGSALIMVSVLGVVVASSALAEVGPEVSPAGTKAEPVTFTVTFNGEATLESTAGKKLVCKKGEGQGSFTTSNTGKMLVSFKECTAAGVTCNSPGDGAGVMLVEYELRLVSVLPGGTLDFGIWLEPIEPGAGGMLTFTCLAGLFKAKLLGALISVVDSSSGALLKEKESGKEYKVLWKAETAGEQGIKECDTPAAFCEVGGKRRPVLLEAEFTSGFHELTAQVADATMVFGKNVEFRSF